MTRLELASRLIGEQGQALTILPWWEEAFRALDDPVIRELILWLARQTGKSQCAGAMAQTEVLTVPGSYTLIVSAGAAPGWVFYTRKIRRPLERVLAVSRKSHTVKFNQSGLEVLAMGSVLEVIAPNEVTVPGRSPTLLIIDEARNVPDEVYTALAPSTIGCGGKIVLLSTAGPPHGFFYQLTQHPTPETWMYHSAVNDNPFASKAVLSFLERRLAAINPAAAQRELANQFTEDGDSFLRHELIEAAVDDTLMAEDFA